MGTKKRYTKKELEKFRKTILQKMEQVAREMGEIREGIIDTGPTNTSLSPDFIYSLHMADAGTDSHEREKNYLLMTRESSYFRNLQMALERIDSGEFGVCKLCGELIPMERMMEVPNATKCVDCKTREKLNLT
jgi:DnaK suppressor protein